MGKKPATTKPKAARPAPSSVGRLAVEYVPIRSIKPWKDNPQIHDATQIAEIDASIQGFGFVEPILVRRSDKEVIHGHGRLDALLASGATEAPVIFLDLPKRRAHALALALNKLAEKSPWDPTRLATIFADLAGLADVTLTGFSPGDISGYTGRFNAEETTLPSLKSGNRSPFQQVTFTLHDDQALCVKKALEKAKGAGPFVDSPNENSNGNALARIAEAYLGRRQRHRGQADSGVRRKSGGIKPR